MLDLENLAKTLATLRADIIAAYLFGSGARDEMRRDSDVDVALLLRESISAEQRWDAQEKVASLLGRDVDLVDLRTASTVMQMQVVSTGTVFVDNAPAEREAFEMLVYSQYARLNEERRPVLEAIRNSGSVYGG